MIQTYCQRSIHISIALDFYVVSKQVYEGLVRVNDSVWDVRIDSQQHVGSIYKHIQNNIAQNSALKNSLANIINHLCGFTIILEITCMMLLTYASPRTTLLICNQQ